MNATHFLSGFVFCIAFASAQVRGEEAAPFELGETTVFGTKTPVGELSDLQNSTITRSQMQNANRKNVGDALNLIGGVTTATNARNERTIFIRGFDSRQVPLFIDGIPVYVPYDGYVDFARFTTSDIAEIQVAKGFSSVLYGPNALGGAINIISRKPQNAFKGSVNLMTGSGNEKTFGVNLGSNLGLWYLQAGYYDSRTDGFPLSKNFIPTTTEDGGLRENSYSQDRKLSLKVGFTPNATDEYSLSYYGQNGEKGQPPTTGTNGVRYWRWPYWNKEGVYFISKTKISDREKIKLRAYQDTFENEVDSFTGPDYQTSKTSGSGSIGTGRSIYNDKTQGFSAELNSTRIAENDLHLMLSSKDDDHRESDASGVTLATFSENLSSLALEDNIQSTEKLKTSIGLASHQLKAKETGAFTPPGTMTSQNAQLGFFYLATPKETYSFTVAQKTRFPTLKDRYSIRLGLAVENPDLQPEKALNFELGYQKKEEGLKLEASIFDSEVSDLILQVNNVVSTKYQMQNGGKVRVSGIELALSQDLSETASLHASYTYVERKNLDSSSVILYGVPNDKFLISAILEYGPIELMPILEYESQRWDVTGTQLSDFTLLDFKLTYKITNNIQTSLGLQNITDRNFQLADGFPSAGRTWLADLEMKF